MQEYLKIKCCSCGNAWMVYSREADRAENPPRCPFCQRQILPEMWERLVNSLFTMVDTNKRLSPLFRAEIKHIEV